MGEDDTWLVRAVASAAQRGQAFVLALFTWWVPPGRLDVSWLHRGLDVMVLPCWNVQCQFYELDLKGAEMAQLGFQLVEQGVFALTGPGGE